MHIAQVRFEQLVREAVGRAMAAMAPDMRAKAAHIVFKVANRDAADPELLGLFEGLALGERHLDDLYYLPDEITLFRLPLAEMCADEEELVREIRITILHELGHFFGFGEDELDKLGYS